MFGLHPVVHLMRQIILSLLNFRYISMMSRSIIQFAKIKAAAESVATSTVTEPNTTTHDRGLSPFRTRSAHAHLESNQSKNEESETLRLESFSVQTVSCDERNRKDRRLSLCKHRGSATSESFPRGGSVDVVAVQSR